MNYQQALAFLQNIGQEQLLAYYDELTPEEQADLLSQISSVDFSCLSALTQQHEDIEGDVSPCPAVSQDELLQNEAEYFALGAESLKKGEVAAVMLAGGQGTRLGFSSPKGTYNMGLTRTLSIFECQMNNLKEVAQKTGATPYFFIMTSDKTDAETRAFFAQNNYFGYPAEKVKFFLQKMAPVCGKDGKVLLEDKGRIAMSPNGNGGWYTSLMQSEVGKIVKEQNIQWLNVFAVDNVLQRICDPLFVGATLKSGLNCSAKVVSKAAPDERVGVLCVCDGLATVLEYYEISPELAGMRNPDGKLTYRFGVILNYLFNVDLLSKLDSSTMPYHLASKAVSYFENGEKVVPTAPNATKIETLVVDMVRMMRSCLAVEVDREKEFAPVKNKTGVDSVESARELLTKNGVQL